MLSVFSVLFAVIVRVFSNPFGNVLQKKLAQRGLNSIFISFLTYLILSIFCFFFFWNYEIKSIPFDFWKYSVLAGILGASGNLLLIKALQNGNLSVLGPINSYKSIVGIILGVLFLNEYPNFWGIVGMVLIIGGSYFILDSREEKFSWKLLKRKDIQFRLGALFFNAIEAIYIKKIILVSDVNLSFVSWCWFGGFFSFLFLLFTRISIKSQIQKISKKEIFLFSLLALSLGLMQFSTNYIFHEIPVGYALCLFQLSIVVSIFLGLKFFQESNGRRKLIGSILIILMK